MSDITKGGETIKYTSSTTIILKSPRLVKREKRRKKLERILNEKN